MTKRFAVLALAALSLAVGVTVAHGASTPTKHNIASKVDAKLLKATGTNSNLWAGTIDGKLGHGAVRFVTTASGDTITTVATAFFTNGSIKASGPTSATDNGDGTFRFTGKLKVVSATGRFKGAKGSVTVNGATVASEAGHAIYDLTGKLTY
jgi:hypothetical protein